jgi:acyl dehydratase
MGEAVVSSASAEPSGPPTAERTYHVDPEAIVRYAGASGDFTSFHYDVERARSMGYDTLFAMGMLAAGQLGTLAATVAGAPIRSISFRFLSRSWVGRNVTCRVWRVPAGGHGLDDVHDGDVLQLRAIDDTGVAVVSGQAFVSPPERTRTSE